MIGSRWQKVIRDLWRYKVRTMLVVLSIAAGVSGIGTVTHMFTIMSRDLAQSYAEVRPASATLYTDDAFDDEMVRAVRRLPGVAEAEGRRSLMLRFRTAPHRPWQLIELFVLPDDGETRVSKVRPEVVFAPDPASWSPSAWPPPRRTIVLERTSLLVGYLGLTQARLDDAITVETADGRLREVRLSGLAYDFSRMPATFVGRAYGYVDRETLEWLGGAPGYNELYLLTDNPADATSTQRIAEQVRTYLERAGVRVARGDVARPGELPLHNYFHAITIVLGALGVLAMLLSVLLVTNTITALLLQQTRQIGVMKAIGARPRQIAVVYAVYALAFGALALPLALLASQFATETFVNFLSYFLNFKLGTFTTPAPVIILQIGMALLAPLLASLAPVLSAARLTVCEAIAGKREGQRHDSARPSTPTQQLIAMSQLAALIPSPVILSLRNTLRRRVRLALTLTTLTLATAIVVSVLSVRRSLFETFDTIQAASRHDVLMTLVRPYRIAQIEHLARQTPGVAYVESWSDALAYRLRPDGSEGPTIGVIAPPVESALFTPDVVEGRWLLPGEDHALVINADVRRFEPDLRVGQSIVLKIGNRETEWKIVGVVRGLLGVPFMYASQPYLAQITGSAGQTREIRVVAGTSDPDTQQQVATALRDALENAGVRVAVTQTRTEEREQAATLINIIVSFLLTMAMLLAAIGSLGLTGALSLNIIERTREIGVMRAIGASNDALYRIVASEGLAISLASAIMGIASALPLGYLLSNAVGVAFLQAPLYYHFALDGAVIWIVAAAGIGIIASLLPARTAIGLTVRDTLAYDG
ncbi:ABC transporter permease [Roseiflexus sp.]|uniref:ABC transporter permease n=1 Tax=Roseiflexus sp. TaxID=2562120 RepID=UPI00398B0598